MRRWEDVCRGYMRFLALATAALFLCLTGASADTRGLTVKIKASEAKDAPVTEEVRLYGSSHALVIGIDKYTGGCGAMRCWREATWTDRSSGAAQKAL